MYIASWDSNIVYNPLQFWNQEFRSSFPYLQECPEILPGLEPHKDTTTKRFGLGLQRPMLPMKAVCILTWVYVQKRSDQTPQVGTIFDSKPCHLRAPLFERFIILVVIGQILVAQKRTWFYVYIYIIYIYIHNVRRLAYVNIYIERIMYIYIYIIVHYYIYIYNNCTYMCIYNIYIYTQNIKLPFRSLQ